MANIGNQADHPGDVMGRLRQLESDLRMTNSARRLENSAVGEGGIRVHDGGNIRVHEGGSVTIEDAGNVNLTDGGSVRLIGGGRIETFQGTIPGEFPGGLHPFASGDQRAAVRLYSSYSRGAAADNSILIEGRTDANSDGGVGVRSGGRIDLEADRNVAVNSNQDVFVNGAGFVVTDAGTGMFLTTASGSFNVTANNNGGINLNANGQIQINSGNGVFMPVGTTSNAANAYISDTTGAVLRSTSSRRYKQDITDAEIDPDAVLRLRPRTWRDRAELETDPECDRWHIGFVAEEVDALGLVELVRYDADGSPEGIAYDRLTAALLAVVQRQQQQINDLIESRVAE